MTITHDAIIIGAGQAGPPLAGLPLVGPGKGVARGAARAGPKVSTADSGIATRAQRMRKGEKETECRVI